MKTIPQWARITILSVAAIALQLIVLHLLRDEGLLDKLIPWDECAYIYMGISNTLAIKAASWHAIQYAHSPLSILPATVAAFIAPRSSSAPYWVNFAYLVGVFCFAGWALRGHRFAASLAFVLLFVTTPFMFIFTSHIKTDFHGGILFFIMLSLLFKPDDEKDVPLWVPAVLSVLIVLSKPMAFYMPALLTAVFVLSLLNHCLAAKRLDAAELKRHAVLVAITIAAYVMILLPNLEFFKTYIAQALSPIWASGKPFSWKLQFYLPFLTPEDASANDETGFWGRNYLAYAIIIATFVYAVGKGKAWRPAILLFGVALVALIPITLSPQQQWSFGSQFAGALFALVFYMLRTVQQSRISNVTNWVIVAAGVVVFNVPVVHLQQWMDATPKAMNQAQAITSDFVSKMNRGSEGIRPNSSIFFTFVGPVPDFDFGIRYFRQYGDIPAGLSESYTVDQSIINGGLSNYGYVVMYSDGPHLPAFLESNRNLDAYQEKIKDSWNLQEISRLPYGNADYILYRVVSKKRA